MEDVNMETNTVHEAYFVKTIFYSLLMLQKLQLKAVSQANTFGLIFTNLLPYLPL